MRQFDTGKYQITITQINEEGFDFWRVTLWHKHHGNLRDTYDFESFGGACDEALNLMFQYMVEGK